MRNDIKQLVENNVVKQNEQVHEIMTKHYRELAETTSVVNTNVETFLGELTQRVKKLTTEMKNLIGSPFTISELKESVRSMKNQSAPGPLGITNQLLKKMFPMLKKIFLKLGEQIREEKMTNQDWISLRHIVFIKKPGKTPTDPNSYRDISLLNNIYKIYAGALAKRLSTIVPQIQQPAQKGFTRNRSGMECIRGISDIPQHATQNKIPLILLQTDYTKAFPTFSHEHIKNILRMHEFSDELTNMYKNLTN